jgi:hypothetical protein
MIGSSYILGFVFEIRGGKGTIPVFFQNPPSSVMGLLSSDRLLFYRTSQSGQAISRCEDLKSIEAHLENNTGGK